MSFLTEYQSLRDSLPRASLAHVQNVNSDFCNYVDKNKDCYLITNALENERCFYGRYLFWNFDCVDCDHIEHCNMCYECLDCQNCYNCDYSQDCEQSMDCGFCFECKSCENCFGCVNLRHKKYCFFNEQLSKEEYGGRIEAAKKNGPAEIFEEFAKLKLLSPHLFMRGYNNEKSFGDYLFNNKNAAYCFDTKKSWFCNYCYEIQKCEDCTDVMVGEFSKFNYDCVSSYYLYGSNFCYNCWHSSDLEYCDQCYRCKNCFGCAYLNLKEYHILNKPYSAEEYCRRVSEIKDEMRRANSYGKHIPSTYPIEDTLAAMAC
ncbi:hypothetical protein HZA39_02890 [Candidatus Peregrinibacteria bacterium]|nr:hypothetical protein [Candidatus Peregrinibacteria bacterium]